MIQGKWGMGLGAAGRSGNRQGVAEMLRNQSEEGATSVWHRDERLLLDLVVVLVAEAGRNAGCVYEVVVL